MPSDAFSCSGVTQRGATPPTPFLAPLDVIPRCAVVACVHKDPSLVSYNLDDATRVLHETSTLLRGKYGIVVLSAGTEGIQLSMHGTQPIIMQHGDCLLVRPGDIGLATGAGWNVSCAHTAEHATMLLVFTL